MADYPISGKFRAPNANVHVYETGTTNPGHSDYNKATSVTDKYGNWTVIVDSPGRYDIKFFGAGARESDWIISYEVAGDYEGILDLTFHNSPTVIITEDRYRIDVNKNEFSQLKFTFANLLPDDGDLSRIEVFFRNDTLADIEYRPFVTFSISDEDLSGEVIFYKETLLDQKPSECTFQCIFIGTNGKPAEGVVVEYTVILDGVPDVVEYVEVTDLWAINTSNPESGPIVADTIKLQWPDMKNMRRSQFPLESKDAFGRAYTITYEISRRIESYVVFMFVSYTDQQPVHKHPGFLTSSRYGTTPYGLSRYGAATADIDNEPNGYWVYMGEFKAPFCECKLPLNKHVGFWVGFKSADTSSNIIANDLEY